MESRVKSIQPTISRRSPRRTSTRKVIASILVLSLTGCAYLTGIWQGQRSDQTLTPREAVRIMTQHDGAELNKVSPAIAWSFHTIKKLSEGINACRELPGVTGQDANTYWLKCGQLFEER